MGGAGGSSLLGVDGPAELLVDEELSLELCRGGPVVVLEGGKTGGTTWLIPFSHDLKILFLIID